MSYRETWEPDVYEGHLRDIALRRHSALGPWLVVGLGVALLLFVSYLVYANVLAPTVAVPSPERDLRRVVVVVPPSRAVSRLLPADATVSPRWGAEVTRVPQSRATNALLGGAGPALSTEPGSETAGEP